MKKRLLAIALVIAIPAHAAEPVCEVNLCNKIERFSLDIWSHVKDSIGETCFDAILPKSEAIEGNVLSSESRWYQGSNFNPTKKSVTRVNKVLSCQEISTESNSTSVVEDEKEETPLYSENIM